MPFDFNYKTLDDVKADAAAQGVNLPFSDNLSVLAKPFDVKGDNLHF